MIVREFYRTRSDGVNLYKTYSDAQNKILQIETGAVYDSAVDVENGVFTYTETQTKIDDDDTVYPTEQPLSAQNSLDVIFGGVS